MVQGLYRLHPEFDLGIRADLESFVGLPLDFFRDGAFAPVSQRAGKKTC